VTLPPGPRAPAAVNTARFAYRPLDTLFAWRERYGDVFTVPLLVFGTGVYVADPDAIKGLYTGDQSDLLAGEANEPLARALGDHSVLVLDGPEHLRQRRLLLPPFNGARVKEMRPLIREVDEAEVARWPVGKTFAMRDRMRVLTFEVICRAVFGVYDQARVDRLREAMLRVVDLGPLMFAPSWVNRVGLGRMIERRLKANDDLLYEEIELRRREPDLEERSDVLSLLMRARDEDGRPMSDVELRDELMTMLAAGHETTSTGLAWAFDLLLHEPRVLERLLDELGGGDDSYLEAVVTETLRIRPVIDATERKLKEPRNVAGWDLPAGLRVYPGIALVHHRADLYPQPEEFRPERFLEEGAESYSWLPFGGGIRRCIGAALAQAEMAEVLRIVLSRVQLEAARPEREKVSLKGITLAPQHNTQVRVVRKAPRAARRPDETAVAA
jgi:cytochrome P450